MCSGFWEEQRRIMAKAGEPGQHAQKDSKIGAQHHSMPDSDPLHAGLSLSSYDIASWNAAASQPRSLIFRKGDLNMLAVARMPRRLCGWEWVGNESLQHMPVEAQDAVRSAQARQTSILGCAPHATKQFFSRRFHVL